MSNFSYIDKRLCHLCGSCVVSCPSQNLYISNEAVGEKGNCSDCGLCVEVCPGLGFNFKKSSDETQKCSHYFGYYKDMFLGRYENEQLNENFASGGVCTGLVESAFKENLIDAAVLTYASQKAPWQSEGRVATSIEELHAAAGSRYTLVPVNLALKDAEKFKRLCVVGLPCHIQGIEKMMGKKVVKNIRYKIGIFCGFNMILEATKTILKKNKINLDEIEELKYRYGPWPGSFYAKTKDREIRFPKEIYNFYNLAFIKRRCMQCIDLSAERADISIGDVWLEEDVQGYSSVIIRTIEGTEIFEKAVGSGILKVRPLDEEELRKSHKHLINYKKYGGLLRAKLLKPSPKYENVVLKKIQFGRKIIELLFTFYLLSCRSKVTIFILNRIPDKTLIKISSVLKKIKKKLL